MNYGKNNLSRRKQNLSSKKRMQKKRVGVRFFKAMVICILLLGIICVVGAAVFAKKIIDNAPAVSADDILPKGYTTNIVDVNGTTIDTLKDSDSNRVYRTYAEITANNDFLPHAFVAIEDERFYEHNGIDLQGIIRAGLSAFPTDSIFQKVPAPDPAADQKIMYFLISSPKKTFL